MSPLKIDRGIARGSATQGFAIEILHPGLKLGESDSGIGAIGRIDRASVRPGHLIAMHPHQDDEILTYVRAGSMLHRDSVGHEEKITPTRLMMMNAGRRFQHEERMLGVENVRALQIFLRPRSRGLEPKVQFHDFVDAESRDEWRLLAAPAGAPLEVRAQAWVEDVRLSAGRALALPDGRASGAVRLLYVFEGEVRIGDVGFAAGESAYLVGDAPPVRAVVESDLVLFTTDPAAPVFKGGMFSGNVVGR